MTYFLCKVSEKADCFVIREVDEVRRSDEELIEEIVAIEKDVHPYAKLFLEINSLIDGRAVRNFSYRNGIIEFDLEQDGEKEYNTIKLSKGLQEDALFQTLLANSLKKYKSIDVESAYVILSKKSKKQEDSVKEDTLEFLKSYAPSLTLDDSEYDEDTLEKIYEYLEEHKTELSKLGIKIKNDSKLVALVNSLMHWWFVPPILGVVIMIIVCTTTSVPLLMSLLSIVSVGLCVCPILFIAASFNPEVKEISANDLEKIIDSLMNELDKKYSFSKEMSTKKVENTRRQKFLEFVLSDVKFIREYDIEEFSSEAVQLKSLVESYMKTNCESYVEKYGFFDWLVDIEISIYSKEENSVPFISDIESLLERLECLGYSKELVFENRFLMDIIGDIARILKTPYLGCNRELLKLVKLAQSNALASLDSKNEKFSICGYSREDEFKCLGLIEEEITKKINETIDGEESSFGGLTVDVSLSSPEEAMQNGGTQLVM